MAGMTDFRTVPTPLPEIVSVLQGASVMLTGSRTITRYDAQRIARVLRECSVKFKRLHHGDARGADREVSRACVFQTIVKMHDVQKHPADWSLGRRAGPIRNAAMVGAVGVQERPVVLAVWDGSSRGTHHAICAALSAGLPVVLVQQAQIVGFARADLP